MAMTAPTIDAAPDLRPEYLSLSGRQQYSWAVQVLGTPTREDIASMNPNYTDFKFPQIKAHPWNKVFSKRMPADAVDLVRSNHLVMQLCRTL